VNQGLELGVGLDDVVGDGAEDVDFEVVVFRVLEGRCDQFLSEAAAAEFFGDLGVDKGQPALAVGFEFEIAGFAVLGDLEAAAGYLGWVVHGESAGVDDSQGLAVQAGALRAEGVLYCRLAGLLVF
jgi:hypothetical protein